MPLVVRVATRTDIPAIVDICERAFLEDPIFKYMYPGTTPSDSYAFRTRMFEEEWSLPGRICFVLADTDFSSIIAFSRWYYPYSLTPEQEAAGLGEDKVAEPPPTGAVELLYIEFFTKLFSGRKKWANHSTTYGWSGVFRASRQTIC